MNLIGAPIITSLIIEPEYIDWLDKCAANLARQRNCEVSRSEAANYIFRSHKIKMIKAMAKRNHNAKAKKAAAARH